MKFFIATKNEDKKREFSEIFAELGIELVSEKDIDVSFPDVEEDGTTFEENSLIKARNGAKYVGMPTVADDSGLCVDYLGGAPGIYSARYAGGHGDNDANNKKLLAELEGVPEEKRTARFVSVVACVFPDGREFTVRGEGEGKIGFKECGNGGFGYDPLFITRIGCFGEVSAEAKNSISHRAVAIKKFKEEIKKYVD